MSTGYKTEQEAVVAAKEHAEAEGLVEFSGMNCNDWDEDVNCGGWDGVSRRCECGNRRVSWNTFENTDGTFTAYAEAY